MESSIVYRLAGREDIPKLIVVGNQLFDNPVDEKLSEEFIDDTRHHLMLALSGEDIVGMASGFHYIHPDKAAQLFINEVGVVDEFQSQGIGRTLVGQLCKHGKQLGCKEAWVGTESGNAAARKSYKAAGGIEDDESFILIEFDLS